MGIGADSWRLPEFRQTKSITLITMQSFVSIISISFIFNLQHGAVKHSGGKRQTFMVPSLLLCRFLVFNSVNQLREMHMHLLNKFWCCKWWTHIKISSLFPMYFNISVFFDFFFEKLLGWLPDCQPDRNWFRMLFFTSLHSVLQLRFFNLVSSF